MLKGGALIAAVIVVSAAAATMFVLLFGGAGGNARTLVFTTPTPRPFEPTATPLPATWLDGLDATYGDARPYLISCLDENGDGRIDSGDGADVDGLEIDLGEGACHDPASHADVYEGWPSDPARFDCAAGHPAPLLIVAIGSAGTDLLDPSEGESLGMLDIINVLQTRAQADGIATQLLLSTSAVFGAKQPQTSMEHWLTRDVGGRLNTLPCLRAVLIGHSHGGATVTSVTAALDRLFAQRMLGVLIDRTVALYDRPATEMPAQAQILNYYQLNEGWHGDRIDAPNVANYDETQQRAPVAPSDGGGGLALVSHKTLDDSRAVQQSIVDAVMTWVRG